ncbi:MAG: M23 family metallopeptidase [candidate division WOR-3 bacterium]|nr:MAG: M23 family metallopeptidase [candidate division WOR-3 bacterium]
MIGLGTLYKTRFSQLIILFFIIAGCSREPEFIITTIVTDTKHVVEKGETLETILDKLSVAESRVAIISALEKAGFPFRKCIPGDTVSLVKEDGRFSHLTYRQNFQNTYYVNRESGYLTVAMNYPYFDTSIAYVSGTVNSTLYESMLASGETSHLVIRFADVFAWEVDFFTDTQDGDSFFIYFKKIFCDSALVDYGLISFARYKGAAGDFYGFYYRDPEGHDDYYNQEGQSLRKSLLKSPLRFSYISSHYSKRRYHPILKRWRPHHGLDYVAPIGTPIASIGAGKVTYRGWKGGYGNLVEIRHANNFRSRYGHLSRFAKNLYVGKRVKSGELIGYLGSTGLSTGPHLHFELHKNGVPINPLRVKIPRAPSVKKKYMDEFMAHRDSVLDIVHEVATDGGEALPET